MLISAAVAVTATPPIVIELALISPEFPYITALLLVTAADALSNKLSSSAEALTSVVFPLAPIYNLLNRNSFTCEFASVTTALDAVTVPFVNPDIRETPSDLSDDKGHKELLLINAMEEALQEGHSQEYQELIKLYFYNLQNDDND